MSFDQFVDRFLDGLEPRSTAQYLKHEHIALNFVPFALQVVQLRVNGGK